LAKDPRIALQRCFKQIDSQVLAAPGVDTQESGSTACVLYFRGSQLWTAVLGDSRAVAGKESTIPGVGVALEAYRLTEDQKPEDPSEESRITQAGGYVSDGRVWLCEGSDEGGLAVSRAIGDHMFSNHGIVSDPVITSHAVAVPETKVIVVASDGLWEFVEDQEAINIVSGHASASRAAAALLEEGKARWKKSGGGYRDDITVGVLYLPLWRQEEPGGKANPAASRPTATGGSAPAAVASPDEEESGDDSSDEDDDLAAMMMLQALKGTKQGGARSKAEAPSLAEQAGLGSRHLGGGRPGTPMADPMADPPSEGIAMASMTEATDISPAASEQSFSMAFDSEAGGSVASAPRAKAESSVPFNLKDSVRSLMQSEESDTDSD